MAKAKFRFRVAIIRVLETMSHEEYRTIRKALMYEVERAKTQEEKQKTIQALFEHVASHAEFL